MKRGELNGREGWLDEDVIDLRGPVFVYEALVVTGGVF